MLPLWVGRRLASGNSGKSAGLHNNLADLLDLLAAQCTLEAENREARPGRRHRVRERQRGGHLQLR